MPRLISDEALVLHKHVLGESDVIVTLLCRKLGKLSAVAPHARSSRRRFGGCLELFNQIEIELVERRKGSLLRMQEASLRDHHPGIRSDLIAIAHAGYLSELSAALTKEGIEIESIFCHLAQALNRLDQGPLASWEIRRFEIGLLDLLGILPELRHCVVCGIFELTARYHFDYHQGGLVCQKCKPNPGSLSVTNKLVLVFQYIAGYGALVENIDKTDLTQLRALLDSVIDQHIKGRLHARDFLRQLFSKHSP